MAATTYESLRFELSRIVNSTYPASLKSLNVLLVDCQFPALQQWANQHPNQVDRIARRLVESLFISPWALEIARELCQIRSIRDAFLLCDPKLLNEILQRAKVSNMEAEKYVQLCVILLSQPLPDEIVLPAAAETFFRLLFQKTIAEPTLVSIKPVFALLNGACAILPELLPQSELIQMLQHLKRMSRSGTGLEAQEITVLSLATIGALNMGCIGKEKMTEHNTDESWKFFTGELAQRTINLVVLYMIQRLKKEDIRSTKLAWSQMMACRTVLHLIEEKAILEWTQRSHHVLEKLYEKAIQPALAGCVRLEVFAILTMFYGVGDLPKSTVLIYERDLLELDCSIPENGLQQTLSVTLPFFASVLTENFFLNLIKLLSTAALQERQIPVLNKSGLTILAKELSILVLLKEQSRTALENAMRRDDINCLITELVCRTSVVPLELEQQLLFVVLISMIRLSSSVNDLRLGRGILERLSMTPRSSCSPVDIMTLPRDRLLRPNLLSSHRNSALNNGWKQKLVQELASIGNERYNGIVAFVEEMCSDLEERCWNIEEPLRQRSAQIVELEGKEESLKQQVQELAQDLSSERDKSIAVQAENQRLNTEYQSSLAQSERHQKKLYDVQNQLVKTEERHKTEIFSMQQRLNDQELELRSTIASQVEKTDDKGAEVLRLEQERDQHLEASEAYRAEMESKLEYHQQSMADLRNALQVEQEHNVQGSKTIERLEARISSLQSQIFQSSEHLRNVETKLEKSESDKCRLRSQLDTLEQEFCQIQDQNQLLLDSKEELIKSLEVKLQKSAKELMAKLQQLKTAEQFKTRLAAAMQSPAGHGEMNVRDTIRAVRPQRRSRRTNQSSVAFDIASDTGSGYASPAARRHTVPEMYRSPDDDFIEELAQQAHEDVNTSFASSTSSKHGSTPKRPKYKAFKIPLVRQPAINSPMRAQSSDFTKTLSSASGNIQRRHRSKRGRESSAVEEAVDQDIYPSDLANFITQRSAPLSLETNFDDETIVTTHTPGMKRMESLENIPAAMSASGLEYSEIE